jgi:arabinoxylan arabinofuranohydrolase
MASLLFFCYCSLLGGGAVNAANPIVSNVGMADPHIHAWSSDPSVDHAFYIYATHDYSANNTGFLMKDWWVWRSADLVSWEEASVLEPENTPADPSTYDACWATDAATNGAGDAYFFYLSIGAEDVAVVNASSPVGPWTDAVGAPLLPASLGSSLNPPTTIRDPSVFWDGAAPFIIFGTFTYYVARLGDDMMSLAEKPRLVTVIDPTGPYGNSTDDKPFVHRKDDLWYLSWGCFYSTSNSSYGPYTYRGSFLDTDFIAPAFRTNMTDGPWYSHGDYADRHGSFFVPSAIKAPGHAGFGPDLGSVQTSNDYWVGNDRSHSAERDPANAGYFRDSVMGYVHYRVDGSIVPVLIDEVGVGEYDGSAPRIEAENFFTASGAVRKGHEFVEGREGAGGGGGDRVFMAAVGASSLTFPHVRAIGSATGGGGGGGGGGVLICSVIGMSSSSSSSTFRAS